ncbi:TraC family protein [Desulfobulbus alkaliphilus]|nr:TraC family protein [Desulfobulbus alkaliphilus]
MLAPRPMPPSELLEWARRLFNQYSRDYPDRNLNSYDEAVPLRKQIINAETLIRVQGDHLCIGVNFFCCTTPKAIPVKVDSTRTRTRTRIRTRTRVATPNPEPTRRL